VIVVRIRRDGVSVREAVFREGPVILGRSASSDLVLVDGSVSHSHARLEQDADGTWVLTDLDSRNGLRQGPEPQPTLRIEGPTLCRLGRAEIELEPVADTPTLELSARDLRVFDHRRGLLHHVLSLAMGVAGGLSETIVSAEFWSPWSDQRGVVLLSGALSLTLFLPILAGGLLMALRFSGRRLRLADTLRAVAWLTWLWPAMAVVSSVTYYVLPGGAQGLLEGLVPGLLIVISVVHVAALRRAPPGRTFRLAWAAGVTALLAGYWGSTAWSMKKMGSPDVDYEVQMPLGSVTGPVRPLEDYFEAVSREARVAEEAAAKRAASDAAQ
jgi:hypothetical protein